MGGAKGEKGEKGEKGDRGNDGTGLKLKDFVLGQTYNHGDYVFSKSSKGNHDSMYIAERTFHAAKEPRFDMDSGNWVEFHAPHGADGMKGDKGDKGEKGETGATGIQGKDDKKGEKGERGVTGAQG